MSVPAVFLVKPHHRGHKLRHINGFSHDGYGVRRQRVLLHLINVVVDTGRYGEDERDADNTDTSGKRGQESAALFCHQVIE